MKRFVALLVILVSTSLLADEGMWMPQQVPQFGDQLKKMGLQLDPRQLADLTGFPMNAIVSTGGCSASFVSPQGLIVTNHHCVHSYLQYNSTAQKNRIVEGFLAKTMADEPQASPGSRVFVTTAIEDVTDKILAGLEKKKMTDIDRFKTIDRRRKETVSACEKGGGLRCQVASFFEGTQFLQVTQMEIRDVRLVYAPPEGVGNFGGETDNWMWPRHTGDFGYIRAYVGKDGRPADFSKDNVPYQPKHYLKIGTGDIDPGDLMLVVGYPGITFRYKTAAETRTAQEFEYPTSIQNRRDLMAILEERGKNDEAVAIRNATRVRSLANFLKKYEGTLEGFKKGNLIARREAEEKQLATLYANDARSEKELDAVMAELERIRADLEATQMRDTVLAWLYTASPMLTQANSLYRLSVERAKKDVDRVLDYQERDWPQRKAAIERAQRVIDPPSDRAGLRHFLLQSQKLPADQRIKPVDEAIAAAGGVDPLLDRLYGNTKIADLDARNAMFGESTAALRARNDAFIDLAASLRRLGDELEKRDEVNKGAMARLRPRYVQSLKTLRGGLLAPDANSTLRVSFGVVKGYEPRDGVMYEPQTTIEGIVAKDTGEGEFMSPKRLLERSSKREFGPYADPDLGTVPVDFLSTGDITNGSSGSASLNAKGELVGLAFDGNYEAMGSDYVVNPELSRTIHVDGRYMLWVMDAVDGAHNLLREMGVTPQFEAK